MRVFIFFLIRAEELFVCFHVDLGVLLLAWHWCRHKSHILHLLAAFGLNMLSRFSWLGRFFLCTFIDGGILMGRIGVDWLR